MTASHPLADLLTYIEEVERLNKTPAFQVPEDVLALRSGDVADLPGVATDLEQDGAAWLVISRLTETPPPALPDFLRAQVTLSASPDKRPVLSLPELSLEDAHNEGAGKVLDLQESFESYLHDSWLPWAEVEGPRRQSIALYKALFSLQQKLAGDGEAPLELVWGMGLATWRHPDGKAVNHPLLTQGCFIELDKESFTLAVRPRDVEPHLELDCYVELDCPGVRELESYWVARKAVSTAVNPFQPSTFVDVLRTAVGYLDPAGLLVDDYALAGPQLAVSPCWVLYARKRSADVFVEDVRRFQGELLEGADIPAVVQAFVSEAEDVVKAQQPVEFRGLSSSSDAPGVKELYFPLSYNEEQVEIVRKLELSDGVVVQGPPGTGKTHTIANIVAHYLAQGKRVLVTSKGDTALSVLQDKLPEDIRALSVALLANERAGMKQFEHSIQKIAARIAAIRPTDLEAGIAQLEEVLAHTHSRLAYLDGQLAEFSRRNDATYIVGGREYGAEDLARFAESGRMQASWLKDVVPADGVPPLTEMDVSLLRAARLRLGKSLAQIDDVVPSLELLPTWSALLSRRGQVLREKLLREQLASGALLSLNTEAAGVLESMLAQVTVARGCLALASEALVSRVCGFPQAAPMLKQFGEMVGKQEALEHDRQSFLASAVRVPADVELNEDFAAAVARLADGKSAFSLGASLFGGKKAIQPLLDQCLVLGVPARSEAQWKQVQALLPWRHAARALVAQWNALCGELGLPSVSVNLDEGFRQVSQYLPSVAAALQFAHQAQPALRDAVVLVFGSAAAEAITTLEGLAQIERSTAAHLELAALAAQAQQFFAFEQALCAGRGALNAELQAFIQIRLGSALDTEELLAAEWSSLHQQVQQAHAREADFELIRAAAARLVAAGLPNWAHNLAHVPVTAGEDLVLPLTWEQDWYCRIADRLLDDIDAQHLLRDCLAQRQALTERLADTYRELVAERAWLGVYRNSTDKTKQALQSFLTSIQAMGAGTGIRAVRHRRAAREAMEKAYLSVPCWVLPQWRISETLPAEMGLFDLVIIDEASQSDISSLPAILRGKKLLVVGDHKQVSPAAVGVSEVKIASAYERLLKAQPHGAHMTSDKSIYDLARVVFAGQSVMLKEHFRCVPAIIEYSNREFYNGEIRALRVPREDELIEAPLVDVFVQGGYRNGDKNPPEAKAIVDEIEAIIASPWHDGKTIGVVTLMGHEQARLINELIASRISPEDIVARDIVVGQPPAFQGRERDIILLSMVLAQNDRTLSGALTQQQRLNVALSRARDRMYLFRSVPDGHFPADSLSGRLLAHFKQPFHVPAERRANLRDLCESGFERELFDELSARGYRVTPQVKAGGYRIDMVVEGRDGARLAVECDGDRYHGRDKWSDDMARQRVLERAGWTFWRCFASSFVRRRQEVLLDLMATLDGLGIEPLVSDRASLDLVESRVVDPMAVAA